MVDRALASAGGIKATTRGRQSVVTRLERKAESKLGTLVAGAAAAKSRSLLKAGRRTLQQVAGPRSGGTTVGALKTILRSPVSKVASAGAAGFAGTLGAVALAGIASYAITTKILNVAAARRASRSEQAALAADAYRAARVEAEAKAGRPLSAAEQRVLAAEFKAALAAIGYKP